MKALVVYFSHEGENSVNFNVETVKKGHTRIVAEKIVDLVNGDIFRIKPVMPYSSDYEETCKRAKEEYENGICPEIECPFETLGDYDSIFIGFPIWFRSYPRVIATFVKKFDFSGKVIYPFCTNEEGAFGMADMELAQIARAQNAVSVKGLAIRGSNANDCEQAIKSWLGIQ